MLLLYNYGSTNFICVPIAVSICMLITFEVIEEKGELVAVHDGNHGVIVAIGYDWDMLRDTINESVASAIGESYANIEIEVVIDDNHRTRFKHQFDLTVAERIKYRLDRS